LRTCDDEVSAPSPQLRVAGGNEFVRHGVRRGTRRDVARDGKCVDDAIRTVEAVGARGRRGQAALERVLGQGRRAYCECRGRGQCHAQRGGQQAAVELSFSCEPSCEVVALATVAGGRASPTDPNRSAIISGVRAGSG